MSLVLLNELPNCKRILKPLDHEFSIAKWIAINCKRILKPLDHEFSIAKWIA